MFRSVIRFALVAFPLVIALLASPINADIIQQAGGDMNMLTLRGTDLVAQSTFGDMNVGDSGPIDLTATGASASGSYDFTDGITLSGFTFSLGDTAFVDYAVTERFEALTDLTYTLSGSLATASSMHSPGLFMQIQDITAGEFSATNVFSQYLSNSGISSQTLTIPTTTGTLSSGHIYKLDIEMSTDAMLGATGTGNASITLVPEPASLSLLFLAGLALRRRR